MQYLTRAIIGLLFLAQYSFAEILPPPLSKSSDDVFLSPVDERVILHYWNFNAVSFLDPTSGPGAIESSLAPSSELITGTGQDFAGLNSRNGAVIGPHLRLNLPIGTSLTFRLSTDGFENIVLKYETRRSGSGAGTQFISYTINGTDFIPLQEVNPVDGSPTVVTLDFSSITEANNNPDFAVRFEFGEGSGSDAGNNRFDNVTLEGTAVAETSPITLSLPANDAANVSLNPELSWTDALGVQIYNLQVSTAEDFAAPQINVEGIESLSYQVDDVLVPGTIYFWRVRGTDGEWSDIKRFATIKLLVYWNFNDGSSVENLINPVVAGDVASISYSLAPGSTVESNTGQSFAGLNGRNGDESIPGSHFRFNLPIGSALIYKLSTSGYGNLVFKYETRRSGSGAGAQKVSYTINGTDFIPLSNTIVLDGPPALITLNFSSIEEANDNPDFAVKIEFEQGAGGDVGNNRFDNVTLEGSPLLVSESNAITLVSPANNAFNVSITPLLNWNDANGVQSYDVQLSKTDDFSSLEINEQQIEAVSYQVAAPLEEGIEYFWRVAPTNTTEWSIIRSFSTLPPPPSQVELLLPNENAIEITIKPTFEWAAANYAATYDLQLSTEEDFSSIEEEASGISGLSHSLNDILEVNTLYYWRARAVNANGDGDWSEIRSFTTIENYPGFAIRINEVLGSNNSGIEDEDGDFSDWIELYNGGEVALDLTGYGLTDNNNAFKWIFPSGEIQPGEFFLVWASSKNNVAAPNYHTSFSVSADGENITLTSPEGITIDQFVSTPMGPDISYARYPDGSGNFVLSNTPTPAGSNSFGNPALTGTVEFSHTAGLYTEQFLLTLSSSEPDATIIYTLDGSDPDPLNLNGTSYFYKNSYPLNPGEPLGDPLTRELRTFSYTAPLEIRDRSSDANGISTLSSTFYPNGEYAPLINLKKATVVKARMLKDAFSPGPVSVRTFFISPENSFNVPVLSLSINENLLFGYEEGIYTAGKDFDDWRITNPGAIHSGGFTPSNYQRDVEYKSYIELFNGADLKNVVSQPIGVKTSGNASLYYPQKSLRLFARESYGASTIDYPIFSSLAIPSYTRLTLRNSGNDNITMFRDGATHEMVKHLNFETQAYTPSVLFINGEYWGIHNMRQHFDKNYLKDKFGADPDDIDLIEVFEVKEGDNTHYYNLLDYVANNDLAEDPNFQHVMTQIDPDSFTDYQIAEIFVANTDWPGNNIMFWRSRVNYNPNASPGLDGRWRWMMKDTDFGFGLVAAYDHNTLAFATEPNNSVWPNPEWSTRILRSLLKNETYKNKFITRFADLLNTTFQPERTLSVIQTSKSVIESEMPNHIDRWRRLPDMAAWNTAVGTMEAFAQKRPYHQRQHIQEYFNLEGQTEITLDISGDHGYIHINTIDILESTIGISSTPYPWTGIYFKGVPVTVRAVAKPGYKFVKWLGADVPDTEEIVINLTENTYLKAVFIDEAEAIARFSPLNEAVNVATRPEIKWIASGTNEYDLQVSLTPEFSNLVVNETGISSESFTPAESLNNTTVFYWRMKFSDSEQWTQSWRFTTAPRPDSPELFTESIEINNDQVSAVIQWEDIESAEGYTFEVSENANFIETLITINGLVTSEYLLPAIKASTIYYARANANNLGGVSAWSQTLNLVTPPEPPVVSMETVLISGPSVSVRVYTTPLKSFESYALQISRDPDFLEYLVSQEGLVDSDYLLTSLTTSTTYYLRAKVTNAGGESTWSQIVTLLTPPEAPVVSAETVLLSGQTVSVRVTTAPLKSFESYVLQVSRDPEFLEYMVNEEGLVDPDYLLTNLTTSTTYYLRAKVTNTGGESSWSQVVTFKTPPAVPLAPVVISVSTVIFSTTVGAVVIWEPDPKPANTTESYIIQVSVNKNFQDTLIHAGNVSEINYLLANVEFSETYYLRIKTVNESGESEWSQTVVYTPTPNELISPVLVSPENQATSIDLLPLLAWELSADADSYALQLSVSNDFTTIAVDIDEIQNSEFLITKALQPNTKYFWRIKAFGIGSESKWSDFWSFQTESVLGIEDLNRETKVYPNPAQNHLAIEFTASTIDRIQISNALGRVVDEISVNTEKNQIILDVSSYTRGLYIIRFIKNSRTHAAKKVILK
jgi:hypothetical protein